MDPDRASKPGPAACGADLVRRFAGSDDTDALLDDPEIAPRLERLLGDELAHFRANLDVRGSVDLHSASLSLPGNAVHGGGLEEAVLCIAVCSRELSAAIFSEGVITVYSRTPAYNAQSLCIKDWITQVNSGHGDRFVAPANVRFATPGPSGSPVSRDQPGAGAGAKKNASPRIR